MSLKTKLMTVISHVLHATPKKVVDNKFNSSKILHAIV